MGSHKFFSLFLSLTIFVITVLLFSCSDTQPALLGVYPRLVYDFETKDTSPEIYLSVFAEIISEPARLTSISVSHNESNLIWTTSSIITVFESENKKKYSGYPSFSMVANEKFPSGEYIIEFVDASERNQSALFNIVVAEETLPVNNTSNYLICDNNNAILFAGVRNSDFDSEEKLLNKYPTASYYRQYYLNTTSNIIYLYPKTILVKAEK